MLQIIWIGLGGFVGAVLRYFVSGFVHWISRAGYFPVGTMTVNIIGCFFIGLLSVLVDGQNVMDPQIRAFIFVGFLGAFTTYSTFGNDSLNLFETGNSMGVIVNVGLHLILGIGAVWGGKLIGEGML